MNIVASHEHFDCPENTDDEEKYVLSVFKKRAPMEGDDFLASLGLSAIPVTDFSKLPPPPPPPPKKKKIAPTPPPPVIEKPSHIVDNFTHFVRHTLALKMFGTNIPQDPPTANDSPALVADLMTLHYAAVGSNAFKENELYPMVAALFEYIQGRIPASNTALRAFHVDLLKQSDYRIEGCTETHVSAWTLKREADCKVSLDAGKHAIFLTAIEAAFFEAIHNIYHLQEYICAAIASALEGVEYGALTYVELWRLLASEHFHAPIMEWQEFSFKPFIEFMVALYCVWRFVIGDILPK